MKKKEQMAALVEGHADMLRCPICGGAMHVEALKASCAETIIHSISQSRAM